MTKPVDNFEKLLGQFTPEGPGEHIDRMILAHAKACVQGNKILDIMQISAVRTVLEIAGVCWIAELIKAASFRRSGSSIKYTLF